MLDLTKPVQTRDGRPARIVATDVNSAFNRPVLALVTDVNGYEHEQAYPLDGQYTSMPRSYDLVNVPETKTKYLNLFVDHYGYPVAGPFRDSYTKPLRDPIGTLKLTLTDGKVTEVSVC